MHLDKAQYRKSSDSVFIAFGQALSSAVTFTHKASTQLVTVQCQKVICFQVDMVSMKALAAPQRDDQQANSLNLQPPDCFRLPEQATPMGGKKRSVSEAPCVVGTASKCAAA